MENIYCVKCKQKTDNINPHIIKTKNNRKRLSAKCNKCNSLKSCFIKT